MKKTFLLIIATMCTTFSFAQLKLLATLNHNDSISIFYGGSALREAHAAAVDGDIITLSPGSFSSVDITKAVAIRGAGMFPDTIAKTIPTTILNNFTVNIADTTHVFTLEGVNCANYMYYNKIRNPQFVKCFFNHIYYYEITYGAMENATFINCVIYSFGNSGNYSSGKGYAQNTTFVNSVIMNMSCEGTPSLINCVAGLHNSYVSYVGVANSILYCSYTGAYSSNSAVNSIGINTNSSYNYFSIPDYLPGFYNLRNYHNYEDVFKFFRGTFNDNQINLELQDSIATTFLGTDGTQVGIYGGQAPFDPSVRSPLIKNINVAQRPNAEGKLEVEVEIVSE